MDKPKPKIAISLNCGWTIRNWVYTGILKELSERFDLLVLSPVADSEIFREIVSRQRVSARFVNAASGRRKAASSGPGKLKNVLFNAARGVETFRIRLGERSGWPLMTAVLRNLHRLPGLIGVARLAASLEGALESDPGCRAILKDFKPDLLISAHPFAAGEIRVLREASKAGIPILASILSWDNLSTKGMLSARFDKVLVWSSLQAEQFLGYYPRYKKDQVRITGIPHFDVYAKDEPAALNRERLPGSLNIPAASTILLYCTSAEVLVPHEPDIIADISGWLVQGKLPKDVHLLIRCHPHDRAERYRRFLVPGRVSVFASSGGHVIDPFTWIPPEDEITILTAMLKSSAICLNVASTTSLDALACGTPAVNIAYDGDESVGPGRSVRRFYDFTHYKDVVKTGGVRIARDPNELLDSIKMYLGNPAADLAERRRLVEEQCWKVDGKSSERVVEAIAVFLNETRIRRHANPAD